MKLYEVPRHSRIKIGGMELEFHHIDGMYSYCTDSEGKVYHIDAYANVEVVNTQKEKTHASNKHN